MRTALKGCLFVALLAVASTAQSVPIKIEFEATIADFFSGGTGGLQTGDKVSGWWLFDSQAQAQPTNLVPGSLPISSIVGQSFVSSGSNFGFSISVGSYSFFHSGVNISIWDNADMWEFSGVKHCSGSEGGSDIADVYNVSPEGGGVYDGPNFTLFNCGGLALNSESLPTFAPRLGTGPTEFVQGGLEANGWYDFVTDDGDWVAVFLRLGSLRRVAVPEPGTLALFGLGLAGLGFARRRAAT